MVSLPDMVNAGFVFRDCKALLFKLSYQLYRFSLPHKGERQILHGGYPFRLGCEQVSIPHAPEICVRIQRLSGGFVFNQVPFSENISQTADHQRVCQLFHNQQIHLVWQGVQIVLLRTLNVIAVRIQFLFHCPAKSGMVLVLQCFVFHTIPPLKMQALVRICCGRMHIQL